jgi:2-isopropylmalate synthase
MIQLELYDCTLRDGAQAAGAKYSLENMVKQFHLLDVFGIDCIEVGWPLSSDEVAKSFKECKKIRENAKISAFGSTMKSKNPQDDENLNSILEASPDVACIFGKTPKSHVISQLKVSPEENLEMIRKSIEYLRKNNLPVFYDAEHFFDAYKEDAEYSLLTLAAAAKAGAERLVLCDTLGKLMPHEVKKIIRETKRFLSQQSLKTKLGIHLHNDNGLAVACALQSLGLVTQYQGTINGTGERTGNMDLSTFIPILELGHNINTKVKLRTLKQVHDESCELEGKPASDDKPFVGKYAFTHKGGAHIDAFLKGLSYDHIQPEEVGNTRQFELSTSGGAATIIAIGKQVGFNLQKDEKTKLTIKQLFDELRPMEDAGYRIGTIPAEQYLLISRYFGNLRTFFEIKDWVARTGKREGEEFSELEITLKINEETLTRKISVKGGPIDAAYKALQETLSEKYPELKNLKLENFHVDIARRERESSTVRTLVDFSNGEKFQTVGVDSNIIQSGIEAIAKGFNYLLNKEYLKT